MGVIGFMISEYVREQKRYTPKELCKLFGCSEENLITLIRKLKEFKFKTDLSYLPTHMSWE